LRLIGIKSRMVALAGVVLAAACLIAACGASTTTSTSASASSSSSGRGFNRTAFVACLKQHGITLPSRPPGTGGGPGGGGAPGGGGGLFGGGARGGRFSGGGARNPKLAAAFRACGGGAFRGRHAGAGRFRLSHTAVTNFVVCVRKHGYDMPPPNFSGKGPVFPSSIRTNPKFQTAARACQQLLIPARPGGSSTNPSA
jgi:hypothetical protein